MREAPLIQGLGPARRGGGGPTGRYLTAVSSATTSSTGSLSLHGRTGKLGLLIHVRFHDGILKTANNSTPWTRNPWPRSHYYTHHPIGHPLPFRTSGRVDSARNTPVPCVPITQNRVIGSP